MWAGGRKGGIKGRIDLASKIYKDGLGQGESGVGGTCVEMDGVSDSVV